MTISALRSVRSDIAIIDVPPAAGGTTAAVTLAAFIQAMASCADPAILSAIAAKPKLKRLAVTLAQPKTAGEAGVSNLACGLRF